MRGPLEAAVAAFERALDRAPDDVETLIWLGEVHLANGQPEWAAPVLARAMTLDPDSAAARFAAGLVVLAQDDHAVAVRELEGALAADPGATRISTTPSAWPIAGWATSSRRRRTWRVRARSTR